MITPEQTRRQKDLLPFWDLPAGPSLEFVERILEDLHEFPQALPIIDARVNHCVDSVSVLLARSGRVASGERLGELLRVGGEVLVDVGAGVGAGLVFGHGRALGA